MIEIFGKGWNILENNLNLVIEELPYAIIKSKKRRFGLYSIEFEQVDNPAQKFILDSIVYVLERKSAVICESCGRKSVMRRDLVDQQTLCMDCYALLLSDIEDIKIEEAMFLTKDDLDPIGPIIKSVLGEQGKWVNTSSDLIGLTINSKFYGKLWYGDAESLEGLVESLHKLKTYSQFHNDVLVVTSMTNTKELAIV